MAVPFGFSAGDFIAAIDVLHKVGKALKRSNGASAQCQKACLDIESITQVLRRCHAYTSTPSFDAAIAQQIQICCHLCHIPLNGFLQSMEKYRQHLRLDSASTPSAVFRMKRTLKQVDWAVAVQDDVAKLKTGIAPQLAALGLLFQHVSLDSLASQGASINEILTIARETLRQMSSMQPCMQTSEATYHNTNDLLHDLAALRMETSATATQGQLSDLTSTLHDVARQCDVSTVAQHLATIERQITAMSVSQDESVVATRNLAVSLDTRFDSIDATIRGVSLRSDRDITNGNLRQSLHNTQVSLDQLDITSDFLVHIDLFLAAVRTHIIAIVAMLLWLVPMIRILMRTTLTFARSPTLLLSDNIRLTDVLGRKLSLPYEHFRFYPVLLARLHSAFDGCPGHRELIDGSFGFFVDRQDEGSALIDSAEMWETMVAPAQELVMSILKPQPSRSSCPSCHRARESGSAAIRGWILCDICGQRYRFVQVVPASNTTISTRVDHETVHSGREQSQPNIQTFRQVHSLRGDWDGSVASDTLIQLPAIALPSDDVTHPENLSDEMSEEEVDATLNARSNDTHSIDAIPAEAAREFPQLDLTGHGSDDAPRSSSLYLVSRQMAANASPHERFAALAAYDDPLPLHCRLAMKSAAVDYASLESISGRQRLARLAMQSMAVRRHRSRFPKNM